MRGIQMSKMRAQTLVLLLNASAKLISLETGTGPENRRSMSLSNPSWSFTIVVLFPLYISVVFKLF